MKKSLTPFQHFKLLMLITLLCCQIAPVAFAAGSNTATDACTIPTERSLSQDETAWRLFVSINCFTDKKKKKTLTWESWQTQACLQFPEDCEKSGRLQGSLLKQAKGKVKLPRRTHGCNPKLPYRLRTQHLILLFLQTSVKSQFFVKKWSLILQNKSTQNQMIY